MRKGDTEYVSRGCYKSEEHKLMMCNKENSQNIDQHAERNVRGLSGGVQFSVECCQADFCNVGPYPKLENYSTGRDNLIVIY